MPSNLTDVDSFDTVSGPIGTDIRNAASVRSALQTLANRTRYLFNRIDALADIAALKAINTTALPNNYTKIVKGQGTYSLDTGSSATEFHPFVVTPTTGPGRWISATAHVTTRVVRVYPGNHLIGWQADGVGTTLFSSIGQNVVGSTLDVCDTGRLRTNAVSAVDRHWYFISLDPHVLEGATLTSAVFNLRAAAHSLMPANMPRVAIARVGSSGGASLLAAGTVVDSSANLAAFEVDHTITFTPNQNNVIDRSAFSYMAIIGDEGGANAVSGSSAGGGSAQGLWKHLDLTFTVPDARGT